MKDIDKLKDMKKIEDNKLIEELRKEYDTYMSIQLAIYYMK
tara:strand:+ start:47962 stop:48084 length:123 start_codon:yes stop_codon:yes gene_type:complete